MDASQETLSMFAQTATHITLLQRVSEGSDPSAWREFCDRYGSLIRGFAVRQRLQSADCDDVVQDVLASLTQSMEGFRYDPERGKFRSYLKTVTLRAIFKKSCQKRGQVNLEHIEESTRAATEDEVVETAWEAEWRQYHLRRAMAVIDSEFNEADRRAFQMYALDGRDAREAAESIGLTVDQVYQAKSRILKRLTALIDQQVQEEG